MKCVINDQVVLSRAPEGPLAAYIDAFAKSRSAQGYALDSIHRQVLLAACFSHWLKQKGVALCQISSDHPSWYLRCRVRHMRPCSGDAAALRKLIEFLRRKGVIATEQRSACRLTPAEPTPRDGVAVRVTRHLRARHRALEERERDDGLASQVSRADAASIRHNVFTVDGRTRPFAAEDNKCSAPSRRFWLPHSHCRLPHCGRKIGHSGAARSAMACVVKPVFWNRSPPKA